MLPQRIAWRSSRTIGEPVVRKTVFVRFRRNNAGKRSVQVQPAARFGALTVEAGGLRNCSRTGKIPMPPKGKLPNGQKAFDMSTIKDIQKLTVLDARLRRAFETSRAKELLREIKELEVEDHTLESRVENLQKEVDQVANAAARIQQIAADEDEEARQKREKVRNCLEQIINEYGDCLSDAEQFADDFHERLERIGETLNAEAGPAGSLLDPVELEGLEPFASDSSASPLSQLNKATRRKLLVQVELDRIDEELRMEIERNAMSEPASHPVGSDSDADVESEATSLTDASGPQVPENGRINENGACTENGIISHKEMG